MSAPEKSPIIPEQAIRELPRWESVAFLARCALRALPAITYRHEDDYKAGSDDIPTAYECCLLALYSSVTGGVTIRIGPRCQPKSCEKDRSEPKLAPVLDRLSFSD
jgi:hypothetical protein